MPAGISKNQVIALKAARNPRPNRNAASGLNSATDCVSFVAEAVNRLDAAKRRPTRRAASSPTVVQYSNRGISPKRTVTLSNLR